MLVPVAMIVTDPVLVRTRPLNQCAGHCKSVHPLSFDARVDRRGLALLLGNHAKVTAIDAKGADILTRGGARQRYYRELGQ
jgi:hypothetical protein